MTDLIKSTRRGFLLGLLAAPVIVKASSLMPVKAPKVLTAYGWSEYSIPVSMRFGAMPEWWEEATRQMLHMARDSNFVAPYPNSARIA